MSRYGRARGGGTVGTGSSFRFRPAVEMEKLGWLVYFDDKWGRPAGQAI